MTTSARPLVGRVRVAGVVDIAERGRRAVLHAPGSDRLISARSSGSFDPATLSPEPRPAETLTADPRIFADPRRLDAGVWFREKTQWVGVVLFRLVVVVVAVGAAIARFATPGGSGGVPVAPALVFVAILGLAFVVPPCTVTLVDRNGLTFRDRGRKADVVGFERIARVERFAKLRPEGPGRVVVTLDDDMFLVILSRSPLTFVAALQRGARLAEDGSESAEH